MTTSPTILVADDDASIRFVLEAALKQAGFTPYMAKDGHELLELAERGLGDAVITDITMPGIDGFEAMQKLQTLRPGLPVVVISARPPLQTAVAANQHGAFEFLAKPFDLVELIAVLRRSLAAPALPARPTPRAMMAEGTPIVGDSPIMQELYRTMARMVDVPLTVLITGASGTGKERVARALHEHSQRHERPYVVLNLAAIPKERIEAELFGTQTPQGRTPGAFERAEGGTLFLDEIGDMPLEAQARLLRVLQEGEYTQGGMNAPRRATARIICATQRDLRQLAATGKFREDLYYRLQVLPVRMPALKERLEDIPALAEHFLGLATTRGLPRKKLNRDAIQALTAYDWPGNVRELENLIYRLVALVPGAIIGAEAVRAELSTQSSPLPAAGVVSTTTVAIPTLPEIVRTQVRHYLATHQSEDDIIDLYDHMLQAVEAPMLETVMAHARNNQIRAAKLLGINRNTLRKMLRRYGML